MFLCVQALFVNVAGVPISKQYMVSRFTKDVSEFCVIAINVKKGCVGLYLSSRGQTPTFL